jgi:hypothetical protein
MAAMSVPTVAEASLLTSKEIAAFVAQGFLRFDALIPPDLCAGALAELAAGFEPTPYRAARDSRQAAWPGKPIDSLWLDSPAIGPILRLPRLSASAGVNPGTPTPSSTCARTPSTSSSFSSSTTPLAKPGEP